MGTEVVRLRQQLGMDGSAGVERQVVPQKGQAATSQDCSKQPTDEGEDRKRSLAMRKRKKRKQGGDKAEHAQQQHDLDEGGEVKQRLTSKKRKRRRQEGLEAVCAKQQQDVEETLREERDRPVGQTTEHHVARKKRKTRK